MHIEAEVYSNVLIFQSLYYAMLHTFLVSEICRHVDSIHVLVFSHWLIMS